MASATAEVKARRQPLERALAKARAWKQVAQGNRQQQSTRPSGQRICRAVTRVQRTQVGIPAACVQLVRAAVVSSTSFVMLTQHRMPCQ